MTRVAERSNEVDLIADQGGGVEFGWGEYRFWIGKHSHIAIRFVDKNVIVDVEIWVVVRVLARAAISA